MSFHGFGTAESPLDDAAEAKVIALTREWAARTARLRMDVEGLQAFPDVQIPVVRIHYTRELGSALRHIRTLADQARFASDEDAISVDDWIFHLSLAYYQGDRWPEIRSALEGQTVHEVGWVAEEAELVGFNGGPERLLARLHLAG
jgi:2'-5' RNA ligase